jgi:ABC-2 type transport system permease protein
MIRAALYIMVCSARNRLRRRLERLREPRYLVGATVGSVYVLFLLIGRWTANRSPRLRSGRGLAPAALLPAVGGAGPAFAGLLLLGAATITWVVPMASGLLEYSATEVALLFPAPVSRRQLLLYRLLRAQWAVLIGTTIFALTYPVATVPARIRGLLAGWLLLMTCHVFFTGVTLARTGLRLRTRSGSRVAWPPLAVTLAASLTVSAAFALAVIRQPIESVREVLAILGDISTSGLPHLVLWPFVAIVRPLFADSFGAFAASLPGAVAVYAVTVVWVLRADETLDLISEESAATARNRSPAATAYRARPVGWTLGLRGRPEIAFVWKAAAQTLRIVDARVVWRVVFVVVALVVAVASSTRARGVAQALGILAAILAGFVALMLPQMLRQDLRQDLRHLELLKTLPVGGPAVVRGEMAWPAMVTTCLSWACALAAIVLSAVAFSSSGLATRTALGLAGMILTPAVVCAQYTIHNAAALFFPAWVPLGPARPRGVGAMGQRLIVVGATWLILLVVFAPGAIAGWILWLAFHPVIGAWVLIPGAVVGAAIAGVEVLMATEAL